MRSLALAALFVIAACAEGGPLNPKPPAPRHVVMPVASAYRINGVVTLTFLGNPHGLRPGDAMIIQDAYGVAADRSLFPPGPKTVEAIPFSDTLTYREAGVNANAAGSMSILVHRE